MVLNGMPLLTSLLALVVVLALSTEEQQAITRS